MGIYEPESGEIGSYFNCSNMTAGDFRLLALVRGATGAACFTACTLTLVLVAWKRGLSGMRSSTQTRLMSYLLLSTAAYLLVLSMDMEHYWNYRRSSDGPKSEPRQPWKIQFCTVIGFADQYTGSVQLVFVIGVAIYFIYHSLVILRVSCPCRASGSKGLSQPVKRGLEILLVIASLLIPALYAWVPFIAVPYGETGPWCWIRARGRHCHKLFGGVWEEFGMWYIPFGLTALFSLVAIVLFLLSVRINYKRFKRHKGQKTGEAVVLIVFLITYILMFVIEFISHLTLAAKSRDIFTVWILYAASTPLGVVSLPIGLLVYTFTGTLREMAKRYITCNCLRKTPVFVNVFRNTSSFTHVPHRADTTDSAQDSLLSGQ